MKERVTNIKPAYVQIIPHENGSFELTIADYSADGETRKIYKIRFEPWYLKHIARLLWKVVAVRRSSLEDAENALLNK